MAKSIQAFGGRSSSLNDLDLLVVITFVLSLISKRSDSFGLQALASRWEKVLMSYGPGVIDLELEELIQSPTEFSSLITVLSRIQDELAPYPETIPASILNERTCVPGVVFFDYRVDKVIETADALKKLLLD